MLNGKTSSTVAFLLKDVDGLAADFNLFYVLVLIRNILTKLRLFMLCEGYLIKYLYKYGIQHFT